MAREVEDYLGYERPEGVSTLLERAITRARRDAESAEREAVAQRVTDLVAMSGLTTAEFAERVGTSRSRLSTYRAGRVTPSAAMMLRMERMAARQAVTGREQL